MSNVSACIDNISINRISRVCVIDIMTIDSIEVGCCYNCLIFVGVKDLIAVGYIGSWNYCSLCVDYVPACVVVVCWSDWSIDIPPCIVDISDNFICSIIDSDYIHIILNIVNIVDIDCVIFIFVHVDILCI